MQGNLYMQMHNEPDQAHHTCIKNFIYIYIIVSDQTPLSVFFILYSLFGEKTAYFLEGLLAALDAWHPILQNGN